MPQLGVADFYPDALTNLIALNKVELAVKQVEGWAPFPDARAPRGRASGRHPRQVPLEGKEDEDFESQKQGANAKFAPASIR